eukprot:2943234-Pleurochrysis_carterae.AAC.1
MHTCPGWCAERLRTAERNVVQIQRLACRPMACIASAWKRRGCKKSGTSFEQRYTKRKYRTAMVVSLERSGKKLLVEP